MILGQLFESPQAKGKARETNLFVSPYLQKGNFDPVAKDGKY